MKLPKKIKIGHLEFDIKRDSINKFGVEENMGVTLKEKLKIYLSDDEMAEEVEIDTLFHEVLHACWFASGLRREAEEEIIAALVPFILMALRDNPKLLKIIVDKNA